VTIGATGVGGGGGGGVGDGVGFGLGLGVGDGEGVGLGDGTGFDMGLGDVDEPELEVELGVPVAAAPELAVMLLDGPLASFVVAEVEDDVAFDLDKLVIVALIDFCLELNVPLVLCNLLGIAAAY
jgi:hypothetical protein